MVWPDEARRWSDAITLWAMNESSPEVGSSANSKGGFVKTFKAKKKHQWCVLQSDYLLCIWWNIPLLLEQLSSLQISAGHRTFVRQIWGFWLANTESDRTCWLGSSVMTRNKKIYFHLRKTKCLTKRAACQVKPCPWPDIWQAYTKTLFAGLIMVSKFCNLIEQTTTIFINYTSDANDSLFFSPPEIPRSRPGIPITVSAHLFRPSCR